MDSIPENTVQEKINKILYEEVVQNGELRVLNESDTFAIFDPFGHINTVKPGIQGIYFSGTRFVSKIVTSINNQGFVKLSSSIREKNDLLIVDLTNPTLGVGEDAFEQGLLHIKRATFVRNGSCYTKFIFYNFGQTKAHFKFNFALEADFRDIFELRGMERQKRGTMLNSELKDNQLHIKYAGLDGITRTTVVASIPEPTIIENDRFTHELEIDAEETQQITFTMQFMEDQSVPVSKSYEEAFSIMEGDIHQELNLFANIYTSNEQFTHWLNRSKTDLRSLLAYTPHGMYPYAGVPWYNTAFGRDGIITAYETLWVAPEIARNTLLFLAATQAKEFNPSRDAEPGKIFHEMRSGEMANVGEVPFDLYYGTVDATPLFLMLAGAYYERTGDLETCKEIWANIEAALYWITEYGDLDGDGFVEYKHKADNGLTNQGWKDSFDSISYENGDLAKEPIALVEVQGYVYAAYKKLACIAEDMDKKFLSNDLKDAASKLKKNFNNHFWNDELQSYVIALDADKNQCRVVSSNAGHTLFTGISTKKRGKLQIETLMNASMFSGWGIRTLSTRARRFNPMSYHNGSVWPHDVALIMDGMAELESNEESQQLLTGMFDASLFIDLQRMPELFCGFQKREGEGPTNYPVACSPQAWSVGAVFLMVKACLQLRIDALDKVICFRKTSLPEYLQFLQISNIYTADGTIDLEISRYGQDIGVKVVNKPKSWSVLVEK